MNTETTKTMNTETNIKITVKKTRAAASGWKDRGATWREPARYGIYVDGKLRAEIIGEDGGFMGATVWEVKLPWDSGQWEPVSFYERSTYTRGIGERREGFRRFKARIVANPSPVLAAIEKAEARVEAMRVKKAQAQQAMQAEKFDTK